VTEEQEISLKVLKELEAKISSGEVDTLFICGGHTKTGYMYTRNSMNHAPNCFLEFALVLHDFASKLEHAWMDLHVEHDEDARRPKVLSAVISQEDDKP